MIDVAVIGAGPVGSHLALRLAREGHRVIVLEKKPRTGLKSACTGIIGEECALTFGIDENCTIRKVSSARVFSPAGASLYLKRKKTQAYILDRSLFDTVLARRAQEAGAEYLFNTTVPRITTGKDFATITTGGEMRPIRTRAVVIACGFNPGFLKRNGIGEFRDFAIGAQAEVVAPGCEEVEVHFGDIAPGFFGWIVPVHPPMARVGLISRDNPIPRLRAWLSRLAHQGRIHPSEAPIGCGGIPLKPLRRTSGHRLIVVGDAAGQVKPLSGGGIYYGLIGADFAAEVLHEALTENDLSPRRLARYERLWQQKLGQELRVSYLLRRLFERLKPGKIDDIFRVVKERGIDRTMLADEDLSFDWHRRIVMRLARHMVIAMLTKKIPQGVLPD
ncbi:MAG: NAD(P)/FAD-dependent oxidoreductase [Dehalococcoidales bacterium]|nr:NAD(P)/FAD-dependent oxidoreductase [Dehalococcoidales bacterium]